MRFGEGPNSLKEELFNCLRVWWAEEWTLDFALLFYIGFMINSLWMRTTTIYQELYAFCSIQVHKSVLWSHCNETWLKILFPPKYHFVIFNWSIFILTSKFHVHLFDSRVRSMANITCSYKDYNNIIWRAMPTKEMFFFFKRTLYEEYTVCNICK